MKEFTTEDMTEYLKNVMLLESSVYRQNEIVHDAKSMLEENRPFEKYIEKPKKKEDKRARKLQPFRIKTVNKRS